MARRANKPSRESTHKPHIHLYHKGTFRCFSHNASGQGETPEKAFQNWKHAQWRYEREQALRDNFRKQL